MTDTRAARGRRQSRQPLWEQITNDLAVEIARGRFRRGDRFYSQKEISRKYRVSAITSTRVLNELSTKHLIDKSRGRGCVVRRTVTDREVLLLCTYDPAAVTATGAIFSELVQGLSAELARASCRLRPVNYALLPKAVGRTATLFVMVYHERLLDKMLSRVRSSRARCVCCHSPGPLEGVSTARSDLREGAVRATSYLASKGHSRIGYITHTVSDEWFSQRFAGYYRALQDRGLPLDLKLVRELDGQEPRGDCEALDALLALPAPPTAVLTSNHARALHLLEHCRTRRIKIPKDLALMTFDNTYETSICDPPLTVVDTFWRKEGEEAARLLLDLAEEDRPEPRDVLVTPELVIRESA